MSSKWFCRFCWRSGELILCDEMAEAQKQHLMQVNDDIKAQKTVEGYQEFIDSPLMMKLPGVYCSGDIGLGEPPQTKRQRFDVSLMPSFDFEQPCK